MEQENLLDSIICKEQNEIIKINKKTNEMKQKIMEIKEELEFISKFHKQTFYKNTL